MTLVSGGAMVRAWSPGDLALVAHGGDRIGRVLVRVEFVDDFAVWCRKWQPSRKRWSDKLSGFGGPDLRRVPEDDRRLRVARTVVP